MHPQLVKTRQITPLQQFKVIFGVVLLLWHAGPTCQHFPSLTLHVGSTCHHLPRSPRRHQLHATRPRYPAAPLLHSPRAFPARGRPHRALALAELDRCGELPREAPRAPVKDGCHGELSRGREWGHRRRLMLNSVAAASSYHHARRSSACATPVLAPIFPSTIAAAPSSLPASILLL